MGITLKDVEHLSLLSRIAISDNEKEVLNHDLEEILEYISQIKEVTAELGEPETGLLHNVMRSDNDPHVQGIFTDDLLSASASRHDDHILVKKIM